MRWEHDFVCIYIYIYIYGVFLELGVPFEGPHSKDCSILGSTLGSPCFGKLPYIDLICSRVPLRLNVCRMLQRDPILNL